MGRRAIVLTLAWAIAVTGVYGPIGLMDEQDWLEIESQLRRAYQDVKAAVAPGEQPVCISAPSRHKKAPDNAGAFGLPAEISTWQRPGYPS
jgi:hypothetical protein